MPGLLTGVILAPDGTVYISNLGDALVRLGPDATNALVEQPSGENHD